MEAREILRHVDHTLLKATASWAEIQALCQEAIEFGTASVCVPPCYVARIKAAYGDRLPICTVVGFPLGYSVTAAKVLETRQAVAEGADEVDLVVNLTQVKNGQFDRVLEELQQVRQAAGTRVLKVIVETCYLTREEKIHLCQLVTQAGADFIKTSTGFGSAGAALEDVALFRQQIGPLVQIKAAGGIRTRQQMEAFLQAGCQRIGSSSAVALLRQELCAQ